MVDVELNKEDYRALLNWYELAFGTNNKANMEDISTFHKITVMCKAQIEYDED